MSLSLVTPPAAEPLDLATEVKVHCRIDATVVLEDARLQGVARAARTYCEQVTQRQLITATWKLVADCWPLRPDCAIHIPLPPLQGVGSIKYLDTTGALTTLDSNLYVVEAPAGERAGKGRVYLKAYNTWPPLSTQRGAVEITFTCGYGVNGTFVPEALKSGMLLLVGEMYARREDAVVGTISSASAISAERLFWPFKVLDQAA